MGDLLKDKKKLALIGIAILVFLVLIISTHNNQNSNNQATLDLQSKYQSLSTSVDVINKKLDQRIFTLEKQIQQQKNIVSNLNSDVQTIQQSQQNITQALNKLQNELNRISDQITVLKAGKSAFKQPFKKAPVRITAITIPVPKKKEKKSKPKVIAKYLKLPNGSLVEGTVVTGIYAPVTDKQWLPTLINVDEAFYGPNNTRVPLKNCKVLAKAQGDYTTQRAYIKLYELSCVLPSGQAVNFPIEGYVADSKDSALGVHGKLISVTGNYIAGSFLTSFLSGYSSALSQTQVSNTITSSGANVSSITGSATRYAGLAGTSQAFNMLAQYYQSKLNKLIDMIYIPSGKRVWLVIQKGTVIKGYLPTIAKNVFGGVD